MSGSVWGSTRFGLRLAARLLVVLCVVVWVFWFISGWFWMSASTKQASFILGGGKLIYGLGNASQIPMFPKELVSAGPRHGFPEWKLWEYWMEKRTSGQFGYATVTPFGIAMPVAAGVMWLIGKRWRRRWMCVSCEYDLRGLPNLTCPECGTVNPLRRSRAMERQMREIADRKKATRERLKGVLAALTAEQRGARSGAACGRALVGELFPAGSTVMLYAPMVERGEVDLRLLAEGLAARGCRLCVPRVEWEKGTMVPVVVGNLTTDLVDDASGRGVRIARAGAAEVPACEIDVVVVPGLGFDRSGNRIGRGAGFYDKFLGGLSGAGVGRPVRVALALDEQVVDAVPVEGHDARLEWIVTPTEVIRTSKAA